MEQDSSPGAKRGRTRSWVGVEEEKPHAYLREAMYAAPSARTGAHPGRVRLHPADDEHDPAEVEGDQREADVHVN